MKTGIGVIGLGSRGRDLLRLLLGMEDIEVRALCDIQPEALALAQEQVQAAYGHPAAGTPFAEELAAREDIEAVIIPSSWNDHIPLAILAMEHGKYAAIEVGPAQNIQQCFDLVQTSERTGVPCMMLENCCYGREEMTVLNLIRRGVFGEIIHCRGGYQHDLRKLAGEGKERTWHYVQRNGELYPTHELGPMMQYTGINRGNRLLTLCSMSSKARGFNGWAREHLGPEHPVSRADVKLGDIVTTMISCAGGETLLLTHDTTLPRPYSRGGVVQGTRGLWMEDKASIHIEGQSPEHEWQPFEDYLKEYEHPLWRAFRKMDVNDTHGGMDYLVLRAFLHSVKTRTAPPIDVYDTATLMAITCLSEQSISRGSAPVDIPDFTHGRWINRAPGEASIFSLDAVHEGLFEGLECI